MHDVGRSSMLTRSENLGAVRPQLPDLLADAGTSRTDRVDGKWNTVRPLGLLQPLDGICAAEMDPYVPS